MSELFFLLKTAFSMSRLTQSDFFSNIRGLFPIFEKEHERPPPPTLHLHPLSASCAPDILIPF